MQALCLLFFSSTILLFRERASYISHFLPHSPRVGRSSFSAKDGGCHVITKRRRANPKQGFFVFFERNRDFFSLPFPSKANNISDLNPKKRAPCGVPSVQYMPWLSDAHCLIFIFFFFFSRCVGYVCMYIPSPSSEVAFDSLLIFHFPSGFLFCSFLLFLIRCHARV